MEQLGQFDLRLEDCVIETSPFINGASEKKQQRKAATQKVRECLIKEVGALCLSELTVLCLDKTWFKATGHANPLMKEFSLAFEPNNVFFIVICLKSLFTEVYLTCVQKKDKSITFQFQWHQKCGLPLVKSSAELCTITFRLS